MAGWRKGSAGAEGSGGVRDSASPGEHTPSRGACSPGIRTAGRRYFYAPNCAFACFILAITGTSNGQRFSHAPHDTHSAALCARLS